MTRDTVARNGLSWVVAFGGMTLLASCNPPAAQQEDQSPKIQQLERELAARDAEITDLKEMLVEERLKPKQRASPATVSKTMEDLAAGNEAGLEPVKAPTPSRYPGMCYKDYCPCKEPQGGPDMILCDQLEQGTDPSVDLMIAGRSMRQARRQRASGNEE
jgi:hypothetical protein